MTHGVPGGVISLGEEHVGRGKGGRRSAYDYAVSSLRVGGGVRGSLRRVRGSLRRLLLGQCQTLARAASLRVSLSLQAPKNRIGGHHRSWFRTARVVAEQGKVRGTPTSGVLKTALIRISFKTHAREARASACWRDKMQKPNQKSAVPLPVRTCCMRASKCCSDTRVSKVTRS